METKTKKNPCFAQTPYSLTKLCNIFDEAFLFDISIVCTNDTWNDIDLFYGHVKFGNLGFSMGKSESKSFLRNYSSL